jgi:hypothetical protein
MLELPGCHEDFIEQLLYLRVPCLCILQDLTDKVYWFLLDFSSSLSPFNDDDGADVGVGGYHI